MAILNSVLPHLIALLLRVIAWTWRIRLHDLAGLIDETPASSPPVIWVLWHNRLLVAPVIYERFFQHRKSAALISRSKDGDLLASCIRRFGGSVVRGSTSRGGSSALATLRRMLTEGFDVYITPDGPRGPRYNMSPGAVWLAQSSGARILPLSVEYSSVWRLGRWDGFVVPKPFATIDVTLQPFHNCRGSGEENASPEQERLLAFMMRETILR